MAFLPAYNGNATADFTGIRQAVNDWRQYQDTQVNKLIGAPAANGDYAGAAGEAFRQGKLNEGEQLASYGRQIKNDETSRRSNAGIEAEGRLKRSLGELQWIMGVKDPMKQKTLMDGFYSKNPDFAGQDPNQLLARGVGYKAPADPMTEYQKAEIDLQRQKLAQGGAGGPKYQKIGDQWYDVTPGQMPKMVDVQGAGAGGPDNNAVYNKAYDKANAQKFVKEGAAIDQGVGSAASTAASLDTMDSLIDKNPYQAGTGVWFPETRLALAPYHWGSNNEEIAAGTQMGAISKELALEARNVGSGAGMPGAMSDGDRKYLTQMVAGNANTPESNKNLVAAMRALNQRKLDVAALRDAYLEQNGGRLDDGFNKVLLKFVNDHPIFKQPGGKAKDQAQALPLEQLDQNVPQISNEAEYNALPSGTSYIAPDGQHLVKK